MQTYDNDTVTIIIVNYNTKELLVQCLDSIAKYSKHLVLETIVVDNASSDGSVEIMKNNYKQVILVQNSTNIGFAKANNIGIRIAKGNYLLLLNSDTIILPSAIDNLVRFLVDHPDASIVGPKLLNSDMTLQRSWFNFPSSVKTFCHIIEISRTIYKLANLESMIPSFLKGKLPAFMQKDKFEPVTVDYLLLACLMIRREAFEKIGLLDENLFFYHEDCELGYRAKANNMDIFYCPNSQIIHIGGSSSSKYRLSAYRAYFKSLVYVVSKHNNFLCAISMRLSIIMGMIIRITLCSVGLYRDINKIGVYNSGDTPKEHGRPDTMSLLSTYSNILLDCIIL